MRILVIINLGSLNQLITSYTVKMSQVPQTMSSKTLKVSRPATKTILFSGMMWERMIALLKQIASISMTREDQIYSRGSEVCKATLKVKRHLNRKS